VADHLFLSSVLLTISFANSGDGRDFWLFLLFIAFSSSRQFRSRPWESDLIPFRIDALW
jgi:hypothetical protein